MMSSDDARGDAINRMYLIAMALFLITVVIGILNGSDAVTFNNDQILTHVHSGTLGWITLALIATAMWMFGSVDRRLALALRILIPIYIAAFYSGNLPARAIGGTALLVAVVWVFAWVWRAWSVNRTLPGLAVALGLSTFTLRRRRRGPHPDREGDRNLHLHRGCDRRPRRARWSSPT